MPSVSLVEFTPLSADLSIVDLHDAQLRGADLRRARLSDTNLAGADLGDSKLEGADLRGSWSDKSTIWPPQFDWNRAGVRLRPNETR